MTVSKGLFITMISSTEENVEVLQIRKKSYE